MAISFKKRQGNPDGVASKRVPEPQIYMGQYLIPEPFIKMYGFDTAVVRFWRGYKGIQKWIWNDCQL
jgi:hypothetical protein